MWSGLSISRSVAMSFDRLQGCWLVGCLLACLLTWWDGGLFDCWVRLFVCCLIGQSLRRKVSCLVGWLLAFGLLIG